MDQTTKEVEERYWIEEFLKNIGVTNYKFDEARRDRPDRCVIIDDRRIGIEVTRYFWDEPLDVGREIQSLKNNQVRHVWGDTSPYRFVEQIENKIHKAKSYDRSSLDELWLVIVFQCGLATQFLPSLYIESKKWELKLQKLHDDLGISLYDSVWLYFHFDKAIKKWERPNGWQKMIYKNRSENNSPFLWFKNNVRFDLRSGEFFITDQEIKEWFDNPDKKAREEAYKTLEEIRLARKDPSL